MKKATRKFLKEIDKQMDNVTSGTRYILDFKTGSVTPEQQTKKKKNKVKKHKDKDVKSESEDEDNGEQEGKQDKD